MAIGEPMEVRVLLLGDSLVTLSRELQQARVWRELNAAYPWIEFRMSLAGHSFLDDVGDVGYLFDPEPQRAAALGTRAKMLRRDLLTGVAVAAREVARVKPQVVLGIGQGATIALVLALPRICEIALRNEEVQVAELKAAGMALPWQGIQAVIIAAHCIFRARTKIEMLKEALPEVLVPSPGPTKSPLDCFTLGWTHASWAYENGVG